MMILVFKFVGNRENRTEPSDGGKMKTVLQKLGKTHIRDLLEISAVEGFPFRLSEESAELYCRDRDPADAGVQTYGVFADDRLVSVMTATFCVVFPCEDSPRGRIVHISGAFTLPAYRNRGFAFDLLKLIEGQAKRYGADYMCCDSTADGLYRSFGFAPAPENETRMWKCI